MQRKRTNGSFSSRNDSVQEAQTPPAVICPVCGETFSADLDKCSHCQHETALRVQLQAMASGNRFLFGRVKQLPQIETLVPAEKTIRKKSPPKPKIPPKTAQKTQIKPAPDIIQGRDPEIRRPREKQGPPVSRMVLVYLVDVVLSLTLNLLVLKCILWLSGRTLTPLISFSLIPLFFVLLCFTVLYFWLFLSLFKKSLGRMVVDKLFERSKPER